MDRLQRRPSRRLIDPDIDLAAEADSLAPESWIEQNAGAYASDHSRSTALLLSDAELG